MAHLWSGRFDGDPDKALMEFGASFGFDRRLFEDDVTGSLAWASALESAGVLTQADAAKIAGALEEIRECGKTDPGFFSSPAAASDEDVHSFVERELVSRIGEAGRRLHTGRSRNEQVAVDLRLYLKRRVPQVQRAIARLVGALLERAEAAGDALMPSYTHMRRAQPILVSHFFLAHVAALRRDHQALSRTPRRNRRTAARVRCDRRHQLRHRRARHRRAPRVLPDRRQQCRRDWRSRLRLDLPARGVTLDGALQPHRRGHDSLHIGGVRVPRSRRCHRHRQQPDAAEEESGSAGTGPREGRARDRPSRRVACRR